MTEKRAARRLHKIGTVAAAAGVLGAMLVWNGPAQAVTHKGLNGLIVCGGTKNIGSTTVVDFEVFVMNPDGSGRTTVTPENPITDYNPLWTPDGTKILYEAETVGQAVDDTYEFFLMNPDGSGKTRLYANSYPLLSPSGRRPEDIAKGYHPDGAQIAISSNRDGNSEIYKMNADGTGHVRAHDQYVQRQLPTVVAGRDEDHLRQQHERQQRDLVHGPVRRQPCQRDQQPCRRQHAGMVTGRHEDPLHQERGRERQRNLRDERRRDQPGEPHQPGGLRRLPDVVA